jgi:hypothetical protein
VAGDFDVLRDTFKPVPDVKWRWSCSLTAAISTARRGR